MNRNHALLHKIKSRLQELGIGKNHHLLVAVSGGKDSVVLLQSLAGLKGLLGYELSMAHVHHGFDLTEEQNRFRDQAAEFCRTLAKDLNLSLVMNSGGPENDLKSEADFREFRWKNLKSWQKQLQSEKDNKKVLVTLAHHREDALETRLIHLIRGAGESGLRGMQELEAEKLRPLLKISVKEISKMALDNGLHWKEDPSNQKTDALRNWIRQTWLPDLNAHRPGSVESLGRSLEILSQMVSDTSSQLPYDQLFIEQDLSREVFQQLSQNEKRRVLAVFLSQQGIRGFTSGHVEEFLKRIDISRKDITFQMLSVDFKISSDRIQVVGN